MSLPRYPAYKPSGVEWLSDVPVHWALQPCRFFVDEQTTKNDDGSNEDYLSLMANIGIIPYEEKGDIGNKKPEDLKKCKLVAKGDFVINSMNYGIGSYSLSPLDGVCSPVYIVLRPKLNRIEARFATRIFENRALQKYAQSFGNGILEHRSAITWDILKGIPVGIPPLSEQKAILFFLDRETAKIDALIAEQEKLLTLLAEKRQATISHVVTRGLNPNVAMKDSGIAWLREVPGHWEIGSIGYLSTINTGATPDRSNAAFWNGEIPWLKTGEINWKPISKAEEFITNYAITQTAVKLSPPGTMLMAMYGQGVTRGRVALLEIEATYNQACAAISFESRIFPQYAVFFFMAAYEFIRDSGNETSQMNLNAEVVGKFKMTIPPIDEQQRIVEFLDAETAKLDALKAEAQRGIELLKERRNALISAAVTGKIDVRNAA